MPVYQKFNHNATSNSYFGKYDNIIEREVLLCVGTGLIVTCGVQLYHRDPASEGGICQEIFHRYFTRLFYFF